MHLYDMEMEWYTENLADTFELQLLVIGKYTLLWAVLRTKPPMRKRKSRHKFQIIHSSLWIPTTHLSKSHLRQKNRIPRWRREEGGK